MQKIFFASETKIVLQHYRPTANIAAKRERAHFGFLQSRGAGTIRIAQLAVRPRALMILTTAPEIETWITAPVDEALKLQHPLAADAFKIVARGLEQYGAADDLARATPS